MYGLARPFLFALNAETAHALGLKAIEAAYRSGINPLLAAHAKPLPTRAFGIDFPNPVGLAAGLDKNGAHIDALSALGFGFIEIGTTTPRAQDGNPKPRMFRLPKQQAVINRLGFNNLGVDVLVRNVERAGRRGVLGINIGKNADTPTERAVDDYLHCLERVYALADYVTINISSPNTSGLRDLQQADSLRTFIGTLREAQERLGAQHGKRTPMLVKIAPDLDDAQIDAIAATLLAARVDGIIACAIFADQAVNDASGDVQGHVVERQGCPESSSQGLYVDDRGVRVVCIEVHDFPFAEASEAAPLVISEARLRIRSRRSSRLTSICFDSASKASTRPARMRRRSRLASGDPTEAMKVPAVLRFSTIPPASSSR